MLIHVQGYEISDYLGNSLKIYHRVDMLYIVLNISKSKLWLWIGFLYIKGLLVHRSSNAFKCTNSPTYASWMGASVISTTL